MPRLIAATYHPNIEVAEFICDDGRHLLRHGGTLPWRINNPGDLTARIEGGEPAPKKARGYVGFAKTRSGRTFLIFPDESAGRAELKANLKRRHGERTIPEAIPVYAPSNENDTQKYIDDLLRTSGIPGDKKINDCSEAQLEKIADSIAEIEGFHANAGTRKETWVTVSSINATDGSRPLADQEIILQVDGKNESVKSDETGRFPLVIHPPRNEPVHVMVVDAKTREPRKIATIQGEAGKDFNLVAKFREWTGIAGAEKTNNPASARATPVKHAVQPGDTLAKLAKVYRVSIAAIKEANGLAGDRIYAGQTLYMGGFPKKSKKREAPPSAYTAPLPVRAKSPSEPGRSKQGTGKVLALIDPVPGRATWMPIAIAEAKLRAGESELTLQEKINYHSEIGDGRNSLYGRLNAWCAAYVNWCLMKSGYPIENLNFNDHRSAMSKAHGFYEVEGPKADRKDKAGPVVRNPLFAQLPEPVYGAIAMCTSPNGHGHHVGFVYAKTGSNNLILLGGNQNQCINFSLFNILPVKSYISTDHGRRINHRERPDHLSYFVPVSYFAQAEKDRINPGLMEMNVAEINKAMGIADDHAARSTAPVTTL